MLGIEEIVEGGAERQEADCNERACGQGLPQRKCRSGCIGELGVVADQQDRQPNVCNRAECHGQPGNLDSGKNSANDAAHGRGSYGDRDGLRDGTCLSLLVAAQTLTPLPHYDVRPMHTAVPLTASARGLRVGIATSRYHAEVTGRLQQGAVNAFLTAGGIDSDLLLVDAPGSFELVAIAQALASRADLDAVVCIGCVLTGETTHDQYICQAVANGLGAINATLGKPVAFGVLTCQNLEQASARAGGAKGNKGEEAMNAAIIAAQAVARVQKLPLGRPA